MKTIQIYSTYGKLLQQFRGNYTIQYGHSNKIIIKDENGNCTRLYPEQNFIIIEQDQGFKSEENVITKKQKQRQAQMEAAEDYFEGWTSTESPEQDS